MKTALTLGVACLTMIAGCADTSSDSGEGAQGSQAPPAVEWYVQAQETLIGPMTEDRLRREAAKGRFRTDEQVWSSARDSWSTISDAIPGIELGGTEEAGTAWATIFRKADRVPEPSIPGNRRSNELTQSEIERYLSKGRGLLDGMRGLAGQYGPEPVLDPRKPIARYARGRALARMLRHDIRQAVKKGDRERALQDIAAMCALSRQLSVTRGWPENQADSYPADDHYEMSNLVSISVIRLLPGIILDPAHAQWSQEFKDTATQNLQWVDADLRASFAPNFNADRSPEQQASLELTQELMGS